MTSHAILLVCYVFVYVIFNVIVGGDWRDCKCPESVDV